MNTSASGTRVQIQYLCAMYDQAAGKWKESCKTIYDTMDPAKGVICVCNHNTSFAVLMVSVLNDFIN